MKKIINESHLLILFAIIAVVVSSCTKADFAKNFYNPEKTTQTTLEGLYGGLIYNEGLDDQNNILPRYWNLFTFKVPMLGTYTQTTGFINNKGMYEQLTNYTQSRWDYYYTGVLASYRALQNKYNSLTDEADKQGYEIFMQTAKVYLYDQTAQMVDLWGDIPFSQAGQLITTGGQIVLGKFDKGQDVYDTILNDLQNISAYLTTANPSAYYEGLLQKYDFINHGNIMMWRRYCNSLLLRLSMRISFENESEAKSIVQKILSNPGQYPLVDDNSENIQIAATGPDLNAITSHHQDGITDGIAGTMAPGYMLNNIMTPSGDPRISVFFSANKNGGYQGVPTDWTSQMQNDSANANYFSRYDSTTFIENNEFPGIIFTAAEVDFLEAEAYQRWGGGDPQSAYESGIKQSIAYWYYINNLNKNDVGFTNFNPKTPPTDAQVNAFLQNPLIAYTGTQDTLLKKIAIQQWINYGLMQACQGWSEIRRKGYPVLPFIQDAGSLQSPLPPNRLLYPVEESTLNTQNYNAVKAEDNVSTKIFWDVK